MSLLGSSPPLERRTIEVLPYLAAVLCSVSMGCATPGRPIPQQSVSVRTPPGRASGIDLEVHSLKEVPGHAPAAWAFVTVGLLKIGQPELVLLVKRRPTEKEEAPPKDGLEVINLLANEVIGGRRFKEWDIAGIPGGMLGRSDLTGIVLGAEVPDPRLKVPGPTMTVLLITEDELQVARHFGAPRVTNLLAYQGNFLPYPPWVDRSRRSVCTPADMNDSPVATVGTRMFLRGAAVWQAPKSQSERVTLRLTPEAAKQAANVLRKGSTDKFAFFSLAPPAEIDSRLVWRPLGQRPLVVSAAKGEVGLTAGGFVVLLASPGWSGARLSEDGFSLFIPEDRWTQFLLAMESGQAFDVAAKDGSLPVTIAIQR